MSAASKVSERGASVFSAVDALVEFKIASATPFGPSAGDLRVRTLSEAASLVLLLETAFADADEHKDGMMPLNGDHMVNICAGIGRLLNLAMFAAEGCRS